MTRFKDAIREVFPQAEFIGDRSALHFMTVAKRIEAGYTELVENLCAHCNGRLAALGRALWDVVHHRHVHVGMYEVPTLSFLVAAGDSGQPQGFILAPPRWIDLVTKEPLMGVGSVIFTGSQAVDYYNDRLSSDGSLVQDRAASYEAEFLKGFRDQSLNAYQKSILKRFPEGFDVKYAYDYRPVAP